MGTFFVGGVLKSSPFTNFFAKHFLKWGSKSDIIARFQTQDQRQKVLTVLGFRKKWIERKTWPKSSMKPTKHTSENWKFQERLKNKNIQTLKFSVLYFRSRTFENAQLCHNSSINSTKCLAKKFVIGLKFKTPPSNRAPTNTWENEPDSWSKYSWRKISWWTIISKQDPKMVSQSA